MTSMSKTEEKEYFRVTSNKVAGAGYFMVDKDTLPEALEEVDRQFSQSKQIMHVKIQRKKGTVTT
jgi:hypothetical protein